jgi:hypothetical protein
MKIQQLKTNMPIKAGTAKGETFFTHDAHSMHKGLTMTPTAHPILGPGVMIETEALRGKKRVSFVGMANIEEIVFEQESDAPKAQVKK